MVQDNDHVLNAFVSIGLNETKAKETLKNKALSTLLLKLINQATVLKADLPKSVGNLIYSLATKMKPQIANHTNFLIQNICDGKLNKENQLSAAVEYLLNHPSETVDVEEFEKECGVGVTVTLEEIERTIQSLVDLKKKELLEQRYKFNFSSLLAEAKRKLRWADGRMLKDELDCQIYDLLGARDDADKQVNLKNESTKPNKAQNDTVENLIANPDGTVTVKLDLSSISNSFHKPGENYKTEGYIMTPNTMNLLKEHIKTTGGKVITRFPPEPNGILHIGHAKSINFNFGYAKMFNGVTYLRFDDTNPEKEEERFFREIIDMVNWLGYKPYKITHASDYFDRMYDLAKILIQKDLAYVCHQTGDELRSKSALPSPWRNRPIEESLALFEDMRKGKFEEGEATLRMKITMEDGKQDPVAYRIKYAHHARSKSKWCIYPTYDYTHCLNDSFENITHSLCTKEFQSRRSSYYWLCNALDLYCPVQWEFGRLNLFYTVVSKRKIAKLISSGAVRDWDDPRLFTLTALRRRGFPPEAINLFCSRIGITTAQTTIHPNLLDACARDILNITAPRAMAVLDPLKVVILNYPHDGPTELKVLNFPNDPTRGHHMVTFDRVIYIDRSDFREQADPDYKRFAPSQAVGLRHVGVVIQVDGLRRNEDGKLIELHVVMTKTTDFGKPKGFIQWVSHGIPCTVRLYERLFLHPSPEDASIVPDGFMTDINPNSLRTITNALCDQSVRDAKPFDRFQFERLGYFSLDPDSTAENLIFNLTVPLREDPSKI